MDPEKVQRKLTTIFSTDVQGYSRLMSDDEAATIRTLTAYKEVISAHIEKHGGRVIDSPGDNLLAEFGSVVHAVESAVEIQRALKERNEELPENRKMEFRIGINLGDVVVDGERLYGDGVNIAARLEGLAEGGGICISGDAFRQVRNRLPLGFEDLGEQSVKNIPEPVHAYRVLMEPEAIGTLPAAKRTGQKRWRWAVAAAVAVVVIGGAAVWNFYLRPPQIEPVSVKKMKFPLPKKPSIAVLPFTNMSGDPEQEYFSDGITEDLITELSRFPGLFVIARNSTFTYKGKAVDVRRVSRELGVRYVVEGSVRKAGGRVRISAQLIDATTGAHLWAERYDRKLTDIFAVQDEVTRSIVTSLAVKLTAAASRRGARKETDNLQAYDYLLRGKQHYRRFRPSDAAKAKGMFEKAIVLDPNYARAYTILGRLHYDEWRIWGKSRDRNLARALELGKKAVALDDTLAGAHLLIALVYKFRRQYKQAEIEADKAIALQPTNADTLAYLGDYLRTVGRPQEAIQLLKKAMRLDPHFPPWYLSWLGHVLYQAGEYEEAVRTLKQGIRRSPHYTALHVFLAISYALSGREAEARAAAAEVLKLNPKFSLRGYKAYAPYRYAADLERALQGLRKAGLPE